MISARYGSLTQIAHKTDCRCHLCHRPVDLLTYGQVSVYGAETASVDHLWPQSWGVDDSTENTLLAHQGCNSHRGTRDFEEVRLALTGTREAPLSTTAWDVTTVVAAGVGGAVTGEVFSTVDDTGNKHFNWGAAAAGAVGTVLFISLLRAA